MEISHYFFNVSKEKLMFLPMYISQNRLGYWEKMEKRVILFVPKQGVFATKRNKARLQLENFLPMQCCKPGITALDQEQ